MRHRRFVIPAGTTLALVALSACGGGSEQTAEVEDASAEGAA